jgi:DNA polymerase III subunit beta
MGTTVQRDILSKAVGIASKAVGANPVLPLLSNILFESNNGKSRVAGTNLEIGVSYVFPSKGDEFKTCIPAKVITGLVEALHADEVELELKASDQSIMVMTEDSTSNIRTAPSDDFPEIPTVTHATFTMPVVQFKEMIQRVAFASNSMPNATGPLTGVQLSIEEGNLHMFAVDGFHFSYEKSPLLAVSRTENIPFIVKGTTLETISKILPDDDILSVQVEQNKAIFHCGEVDVVTQLLSGEFPDHKKLKSVIGVPGTTIIIPTLELLRAARQLRVFASETGASKLEVKGMLVRYSAVAQDRGDADVTFAAIKKGEDIAVGINVHLLYELLEICKTEYIIVEMESPRSPILFKMKDFDDFYHVIMPIVL